MEIDELYSLAAVGEQSRNVEIKRTMSWDNPDTQAKIVKAILGMSNIRNGGFLILGFEQSGNTFEPQGMDDDHLQTFDYDVVSGEVARYADPFVVFTMEPVVDPEENFTFLVFTIQEFEEIPVICTRNGRENLREGTIYTRSRRVPSTVSVPSQSEMREILSIATEKGIRKYIEQSVRAGIRFDDESETSDPYDEELEGIR